MLAQAAVLLIFKVIVATAVINPLGPTVVLDLANCISSIVENNFVEPGVLIFAYYNNASTPVSRIKAKLLTKIHSQVKYLVEVKSPQNEVDICDNYNEKLGILHIDNFEARPVGLYFIITVDTYGDFPYLINRLIRSRSWNPNAKFIILLFNFAAETINKQYVEKILNCLFKYNVINVAVLVPQANNARNAILYGWRPFAPPQYCGYFNETARERLLMENVCEKGSLKYKRNVFENKIPIDMKGCVLDIIALEREPFVSSDVHNANIEKILVTEMVKRFKLKTSYEIIKSYRGDRESDGQWNGGLKDLTMKKGHLLLGGIFPDNDVHEDFECSTPYLADSYTWVVPRAYPSPPWLALVVIFTKFVWYSVIAGFSTCAISWRILGQLSEDAPYNRSINHCFLNAWICALGFPAYLRPIKPSLRIFYVFFNIYCILVVTCYQTKLIVVLKNPSFDYQVQTMDELVESGLKFGGLQELRDLFYNSSDSLDNFIYDHWIDVNDTTMAMLDVAVHRNFSLLSSRLELAHVSAIVPELSDSFGNFKYYAFTTSIFSVPLELVALRGFAFMGKISETMSLLKQAGISDAVRKRFKGFNNRRRAKLLRLLLRKKPDVYALSLDHLQGGILILALGYASGTIMFALEIISSSQFLRRKFT